MKLSTGKIAFPIEFDNGDVDTIYFNPNDPDLSIRMKDFNSRIQKKINDIDDIKLTATGTPEDVVYIEKFREIRQVLCDELDVAFGSQISNVVFKHCSPFAIVDGEYFILTFLEAIRPEIEKHTKNANANADKRLQKHVAKYLK
jgi:hypothetical protein